LYLTKIDKCERYFDGSPVEQLSLVEYLLVLNPNWDLGQLDKYLPGLNFILSL
jgi:hypothetical protein